MFGRRRNVGIPKIGKIAPKYVPKGPIVKRSDYMTNPSLSMTTKAGEGLGILSSLLAFAPFPGARPLAAAAGIGATALGANAMFGPESSKQAIIGRDKTLDGQYNVGLIGRALDALDGESNIFGMDQQSLRSTENKMLRREVEGSDIFARAAELGLPGPKDGQTLSQYTAAFSPKIREKQVEADFMSPFVQQMIQQGKTERAETRAYQQMAADRAHQLDLSRQQERVDARVGQQDLMNMQLLQNQRQFDQNLAYMTQQADKNRTANLIGALTNLGAAFVI